MDAHTPALLRRKMVEHLVIQRNEIFQQASRRIEFERKTTFGEIDLHAVGAMGETLADISDGFIQQVREESITRVTRNSRTRVKQA